ncbi:hypothetical protein AYL99_09227 [Fonsecaea erecta]|uniref:FAD-binding domain-containing protein n=1 Tax=Fonsecaea erecta TaxID=1367422 RepID=A0A178ZBF6_9EURO|nr:hypothetical protein AYL99_09227 [Fonsecaea erecta]OAP57114.1 hypothetical protein AYL99_09227 [Fonsecaea erecta]
MKDLKVIVVGGGIGGLSTALALATDGYEVTVLEGVKEFQEVSSKEYHFCPSIISAHFLPVGAGIRVPPNSSRLTRSWGVDFSKIKKSTAGGLRFLDWKGEVLLDIPYDDVETRYGALYYFIHRADLIKLLVDTASQHANITLKMNSRVQDYDFDAPAVTLATGEHLIADLVICADGIKSAVRNIINDSPIEPQDTGDIAYRVLVPAEPLKADLSTQHLFENVWAMHWLRPKAHAVGYPLRGGELYNIIIDITHATDVGKPIVDEEWRSQADNTELVWCEPVRKLCGLTGSYLKWKLADFDHLQRWVHPSGKVAILGDACHPMMPYAAQGAAALKAYETQRLPRATHVAQNTRILQAWWHLYDGSERDRRDEMMRHDDLDNPILWANTERKDWLFGHEAGKLAATEEDLRPPALAPLPSEDSRVYNIKDSDLRRKFRGMREWDREDGS